MRYGAIRVAIISFLAMVFLVLASQTRNVGITTRAYSALTLMTTEFLKSGNSTMLQKTVAA
jgi:hypothetical protein